MRGPAQCGAFCFSEGFSRTSMKAPDLGCRGFVDNSPLISCEGVGERHLFFIQRPLTVGVCAKLLTRLEKSWPGSDPGQSARGMPALSCSQARHSGEAGDNKGDQQEGPLLGLPPCKLLTNAS